MRLVAGGWAGNAAVVRRQRVLLGIHADNGSAPVPASLLSAPGLRVGRRDVDVVVLDEASTDTIRAATLQAMCESLGLGYYRSPRTLGTARGMNLVLLRALTEGYDHVVLVTAEALIPLNAINAMISVAEANPGVGSVTAWSDRLLEYPIPNRGGGGPFLRQDMVDGISVEMARSFGSLAIDIPASSGFCMLFPVSAVRQIGLFDPVYGGGHLECVDWILRSTAAGYRAVLAPSVFVSTTGAGPGTGGVAVDSRRLVADQRRIIALRHPSYHDALREFADSGILPPLAARAVRTIVVGAGARWGYDVEVTSLEPLGAGGRVVVQVAPDGDRPAVSVQFSGFAMAVEVPGHDVASTIPRLFGRGPTTLTILDRGPYADQLLTAWGGVVPFDDRHMYPQSV